jgi:hypothetical protein
MAFIPGNDGKNFAEHFMKKYQAAYDAYGRDVDHLKEIGDRLISDAKGIMSQRLSNTAKRQKFATISAQMDKIHKGFDEAAAKLKAEKAKVDGEIDEALEHQVNLIAGLCSYGETAGHRYLIDEIEDYRKAKGNREKRMEAFSNVCTVFGHVVDAIGKQHGPTLPGNSLIDQHERLDGARASWFYKSHREEILSEFEARQSQNNTQKS